jgi:hypothetical protein
MGTTKCLGKQAVVFMAIGLLSNWKQPLGFFICKSSTSAEMLKNVLYECLDCMSTAGLEIKSVIFDQGTNNQKLAKLMNINVDFSFIQKNGFLYFLTLHIY